MTRPKRKAKRTWKAWALVSPSTGHLGVHCIGEPAVYATQKFAQDDCSYYLRVIPILITERK